MSHCKQQKPLQCQHNSCCYTSRRCSRKRVTRPVCKLLRGSMVRMSRCRHNCRSPLSSNNRIRTDRSSNNLVFLESLLPLFSSCSWSPSKDCLLRSHNRSSRQNWRLLRELPAGSRSGCQSSNSGLLDRSYRWWMAWAEYSRCRFRYLSS